MTNPFRRVALLAVALAFVHVAVDRVPAVLAQGGAITAAQPAPTLPPAVVQLSPNQTFVVPIPGGDGAVKVSTGSILDTIIQFALLAFGSVLVAGFVGVGIKVLTWLGVKNADQYRDRLQKLAENGVALAKEESKKLEGKGEVEVKNEIAARAITYIQDHGGETLKALGVDASDPKAVEALTARVAKAMQDAEKPSAIVNNNAPSA